MLKGLRVLEILQEHLGLGTRVLADLGAFVVSIKRPKTVNEQTAEFLYHNLNKHLLSLDITKPQGLKIFFELAKKMDVVVTDESALHICKSRQYRELFRLKPGISHLKLKSSTVGSRAGYPYNETIISAQSGQMSLTGERDGLPRPIAGKQTLYTASLYAAIAILLLMIKRKKEGEGMVAELDIGECAMSALEDALIDFVSGAKPPERKGAISRDGNFAILPCKDGYVLVTFLYQLESLLELLGIAGSFKDGREESEELHGEKMGLVCGRMRDWVKNFSRSELFYLGQAMHFPWAPVCSLDEVLESPQLKARRFFRRLTLKDGKTVNIPFAPYKIKGHVPRVKLPDLERDTASICLDYLHMPLSRYRNLKKEGII